MTRPGDKRSGENQQVSAGRALKRKRLAVIAFGTLRSFTAPGQKGGQDRDAPRADPTDSDASVSVTYPQSLRAADHRVAERMGSPTTAHAPSPDMALILQATPPMLAKECPIDIAGCPDVARITTRDAPANVIVNGDRCRCRRGIGKGRVAP